MSSCEQYQELISRLADGALRDALSLLDQCSGTKVDLERVISAVGIAENEEICRMAEALFAGDADTALEILDDQYRGGKDVSSVLGRGRYELYRRLFGELRVSLPILRIT